jgi:hypothetical protein
MQIGDFEGQYRIADLVSLFLHAGNYLDEEITSLARPSLTACDARTGVLQGSTDEASELEMLSARTYDLCHIF